MAIAAWAEGGAAPRVIPASAEAGTRNGRRWRRGLLLAALVAGAGWAAFASSPTETADAMARAGGELTRLLRSMALLKATMATAALAAVWWRLALPASVGWSLAYPTAAAAMAAGPVLIWGMAHVGLGALLLQGGLFAALVMLWRDPAVAVELGERIAARRRAIASR